jgi:hypothetical protein
MERNNRLAATRHRDLKKNSLHCLLRLLPILTLFFTGTLGFSAEKGIVEFMEGMAAQLKEREAFLAEAAEKPLTKNQEKLLTQLLQETESLDVVLSSQPYLAYLEEQVGTAYKDYPTFLAAVPTTEHKSATLLAFKEILPSEATDEQIQICMDFYFEFRELIVNEPDVISDSEEMEAFIKVHLIDPLMDTYSSEMSTSDVVKMMKIVAAPSGMAPLDTDVFREIWLENLEVYGSREGLLHCAILTPDEFALVRSFFQDAAALEKWIRLPPEQK